MRALVTSLVALTAVLAACTEDRSQAERTVPSASPTAPAPGQPAPDAGSGGTAELPVVPTQQELESQNAIAPDQADAAFDELQREIEGDS